MADFNSFFLKKDIPPYLRFVVSKNDPNLQDIKPRDKTKYSREQYWINQWSLRERWKNTSFISWWGSSGPLSLKSLGREPDDPGDAFFDLHLPADTFLFSRKVSVRIWVEVTEAIFPEIAIKLNQLMKKYYGLCNKTEKDKHEYLQSFMKSSIFDSNLQRKWLIK